MELELRLKKFPIKIETNIGLDYAANPNFPFTHFPSNKDLVRFAILNEGFLDEDDEDNGYVYKKYFRDNAELHTFCNKTKDDLKLKYLDCCGSWVGNLIETSIDDLHLIYSIVECFVKKGCRIYMQDTTQVTFCPEHLKDNLINYEGQQRILLKSIREWSMRSKLFISAPVHRDAFWTIKEGKEYAEMYRKLWGKEDKLNEDSFLGEHLIDTLDKCSENPSHGEHIVYTMKGTISPSKEKENYPIIPMYGTPAINEKMNDIIVPDNKKLTNDEEQQRKQEMEIAEEKLCMVCQEFEANTMVFPCEHCVVCKRCSDLLKGDKLNAKKCVYCRTPIEYVLD